MTGPGVTGPGWDTRRVPLPDATVDLSADVGEDLGGADLALMDVVTTVHVACGFHAGDPETMRRAVAAAVAAGVAVGAHPSYPDRAGFGRREDGRAVERIAEDVAYQVGALAGVARFCGVDLVSVKPHGALYHRMASDPACAAAVASAVAPFGPGVALVVPAGLAEDAPAARALAGSGVGLRTEAFCDRGYRADGSLVPRDRPGAVITDPGRAAAQAVTLVRQGAVTAQDGTTVPLRADTICVHGDTAGAPALARAVRAALEQAGVRLSSASGPGGWPAA